MEGCHARSYSTRGCTHGCRVRPSLCLAQPVAAQGFVGGVAVSSGQVLIAESGGQTSTGVVYVYEKGPDGWAVSAELAPYAAEAGGGFGTSLSVDGDRMLVGSPGAAYVFERSEGGWEEVATLHAADLPEGLSYGTAGAVSGDVALVTAGGLRSRQGPGAAGRVYVFERDDSGWNEVGSVASPEASDGDGFGAAIVTDGEVAAIGAPGATVGNANRAGAVHFFTRGDDGMWAMSGEPLTAPDASEGAGFGSAIYGEDTESGFRLMVGAGGAGGVGVAYAFRPEGDDAWIPTGRFFPPVVGVGGGGRFGGGGFASSFAAIDGELWIGGSGVGAAREGQVLRYSGGENGGLGLAGMLNASNRDEGDGFGASIAVDGNVAVVVAGGKDYRMGTAYILERQGGEWMEAAEVWSDATNYAAVNGHEVGCEEGVSADFDCSEINILSFMPVQTLGANRGTRVNDVWGWTDPQTGREYALVGLTDQASFVDITDAEDPRYVGRLPMTEGARGSVWRDIKVFQDHAFIVSDGAGEHGMQVFDLTRLRDVGSEPVTFETDAHYDGIASAHNIVINEETGFAYSVGSSGGGETCGGGLHMIDINEPTEPTFVGCFGHEGTGRRGTGYSHDALCLNYDGPDREHADKEICFGSNETDISIADVTDKENPIPLSTATYPSVGYAHQGWVTEDHRFFYLGDELDEIATPFEGTRTMIFDISDLDDPVLVKEHFGESTASDHNMYVVGDLLYQSNYNSGLRILNVSDPENPTEVGFIDTVPYAEGPSMGGSWSNYPYFASGTVIVTSGNEGLFMVKYQKPVLVP
ncbi:choice-of-anchor B family protein [Candidatus Palauibacter sp.]|uniref:choice-of-anchor B family protein n=1 Tax=Candidatus Palauibacter sp. TaxID=3101350 RepID=UPI003B015D5F